MGPLRLLLGGASDDGVLAPFMATVESAGVSAGVGSMMGGAGVSEGDELGCEGMGDRSWGKVINADRGSLSVVMSDLGFVVIFAVKQAGDVVLSTMGVMGMMGAAGGGWRKAGVGEGAA